MILLLGIAMLFICSLVQVLAVVGLRRCLRSSRTSPEVWDSHLMGTAPMGPSAAWKRSTD